VKWQVEKIIRKEAAKERRERVKERLEQLKVKKEEQKKQFEAVRLKVKQVKNHKKPLYKMLEESFEKEQMEVEKIRKQKLEQIKLSKRPIDMNKLLEHAVKHDQFIAQMQYKKATETDKSMMSAQTDFTPKYRSKFY